MTLSRPSVLTRDQLVNVIDNAPAGARAMLVTILHVADAKLESSGNLETLACLLDLLKDRKDVDRLAILNDLRDRYGVSRAEIVPVRTSDLVPSGFAQREVRQ